MDEISILKRRLERERKARKEAEKLLETKALALYHANEELKKLNDDLERQVRDRTEELRRSEDKYRGIIEGMELGLLEVDLNQNIVRAYKWFCDMTGYKPEELEGRNAIEVLTKNKPEQVVKDQDKQRKRGQAGVYETKIFKKDGSLIWVLISGAPLYDYDGNIIGSVGIHYDITERKKLENDLKTAKVIAENAQEAEKQFLARMSHEIRTPLNAIIGMVHLLYDTQPSKEQKDYLDTLRTSSDILLRLISYILDISKIEAGEIVVNKNEFDLTGLLRSMQKTFQLKTKAVEVTLDIDPAIENMMIGDDLLLNQILLNLLGNALKFTKRGKAGIRVKQVKKEGRNSFLEFQVYDTGRGIPEDSLNLIFENFKQAHPANQITEGGTGLGLAICKQLIELQKGDIRVQSTLGEGTTFTFNLCYEDTGVRANTEETQFMLPEFMPAPDATVLVVEDNYMNRKYLTALLRKWNISYDVAFDGAQGWEKAKEKAYRLILMDISMPIMDGYQATIKIRNESNKNRQTPIVALTASAIISQKSRALDTGMNDFLPKPFQPEQLMGIIQRFLPSVAPSEQPVAQAEDKFTFNPKLDVEYLLKFYGEDLDYAADMFDTFLDYTLSEYSKWKEIIHREDTEEVRKLTHKIKPTFAMVGLSDLRDRLARIEELASEEGNFKEIKILRAEIETELNIFIPVLREDLEKMELFLRQ